MLQLDQTTRRPLLISTTITKSSDNQHLIYIEVFRSCCLLLARVRCIRDRTFSYILVLDNMILMSVTHKTLPADQAQTKTETCSSNALSTQSEVYRHFCSINS
ncbi:hypothetical protein ABKN59_003071 [Abortiporus biennis]